jgi:hypothetical protein
MKYIIGSLIISFGAIVVGLIVILALQIKAPPNALGYFIAAWAFLAILCYPVAKKIIR